MKEAIYSWIKCLAIFYILLTMLIHLVPTGKYQRYVRFFMGLLLMVMLITPMLSILEKAKTLPESFSSLYQQEEKKRLTLDMENLQKAAQNSLDELVNAIHALNGSWEGMAHDALVSVFNSDQESMQERHRSDGMQSTYRRGAVKSLPVDEGGARWRA